jgi:ADP-heptose:LPS heptosyltransferase
MHTEPRRILIVRLSHLGDVVHGLPVLRALRRAHPRARIGWAVQPEFERVLSASPDLDETILFERRAGLVAWSRLERALARFSAEWTVDAQGNVKSALVALASRAPRRSGMARVDWTERYGALSLTDTACPTPRRPDGTVHAIDKMLTLARHVAPAIDVEEPFETRLSDARSGRAFAERFGTSSGPYAILHLARPGDVRSWPVERFEALARDLAADHDVLVVSGPSEREQGVRAARMLSGFARIRHWIGQGDLAELARLFAAAAARDAVFVGCDSGPMHVAWSFGMRVTLLAGPQDERRTGPWPPPDRPGASRHAVVRAFHAPHCAPCFARRCAHPLGNVCMQRIEPERAAQTVRALALTASATAP